jgi:chromosome segregation ATPase
MSDVENAQTGATADSAPVEVVQETQQTPAPVETDAQKEEQARDEKGRFVQKRINELTREKYEARRHAEALQARLDQLESEVRQSRQPAPDPQQDPQAFIAHLAREEARKLIESERSASAQQQEQSRFQSLAQQHQGRAAVYAAEHPDYPEAEDSVVSILGNDPMLAEVLMSSEHGPAVVHHLGTHLDEVVQLASMPPHLRIAHVARLEARLSAPKPKPVTNAPAPVPTVGGGAAASKDPERMSVEDWMAWRNSQR